MKLAFNTIGCPGWSWEQVLETAFRFGMDGVELRGLEGETELSRIGRFMPERRGNTVELLRQRGLELPMVSSGACLGAGFVDMYMEEARRSLEIAAAVGAHFMRVLITQAPNPTPANLRQALVLYGELCDQAAEYGIQVLMETNGVLGESRAMREFMRQANRPNSGVLWDIHHTCRYFEEPPAETVRKLGAYIRYAHLKDSRLNQLRVEYCLPGEGDIPLAEALDRLRVIGYEGYVSLEWVKWWIPSLPELDRALAGFWDVAGPYANRERPALDEAGRK